MVTMTPPDSATNHALAIAECRRRLVQRDEHRFALPGEPAPGWKRRRARVQAAVLLAGIAVCAVVVSVLDEMSDAAWHSVLVN